MAEMYVEHQETAKLLMIALLDLAARADKSAVTAGELVNATKLPQSSVDYFAREAERYHRVADELRSIKVVASNG